MASGFNGVEPRYVVQAGTCSPIGFGRFSIFRLAPLTYVVGGHDRYIHNLPPDV